MKSWTSKLWLHAAWIALICSLVPGCFRDCAQEDTAVYLCVDYDGDGYGALYPGEQVGASYPRPCVACGQAKDCDDHDPDNWSACTTCADQDGDGWYGACDVYVGINGPDCDDFDVDNWLSCASCQDGDADTWFIGCDAYTIRNGEDCDDGHSLTYPGAEEISDGLDNDCDGISDGGVQIFGKIGQDFRVTSNPSYSRHPSLFWIGSEFGVSWDDNRTGNYEIYFTRVSAAGAKIGSDIRVTNAAGYSFYPFLSWTGSEFGVSWHDDRDGNYEIYFTRISAAGAKIGSDIRLTSDPADSFEPSLAWNGSEFGVSWRDGRDGNYEIYFSLVSAAGAKTGSDLRVTSDANGSWAPSLAWTGSEFGISWNDTRDGNDEIYFARVSVAGAKIGSDIRVTSNMSQSFNPSLSWSGSEFWVSWEDYRDMNNEIYFARISGAGAKIGSDLRVTSDASDSWTPSLSWTGSEFGISWEDNRDGNYEIYFARVSPAGSQIGSDLKVTNAVGNSRYSSLSWTGSEFGVSWQDDRDGNWEIYFARLGLTCP